MENSRAFPITIHTTFTNLPGIKLQREGPGPSYPSIQEQQTPVQKIKIHKVQNIKKYIRIYKVRKIKIQAEI